jgi:hypothetical protein
MVDGRQKGSMLRGDEVAIWYEALPNSCSISQLVVLGLLETEYDCLHSLLIRPSKVYGHSHQ